MLSHVYDLNQSPLDILKLCNVCMISINLHMTCSRIFILINVMLKTLLIVCPSGE